MHIFLFRINPMGQSQFRNTLCLLPNPVGLLVLACTRQCRQSLLTPSHLFFPVPDRGAVTCASDSCVLQQRILNVHIKYSDLTLTSHTYSRLNPWHVKSLGPGKMCLNPNCLHFQLRYKMQSFILVNNQLLINSNEHYLQYCLSIWYPFFRLLHIFFNF